MLSTPVMQHSAEEVRRDKKQEMNSSQDRRIIQRSRGRLDFQEQLSTFRQLKDGLQKAKKEESESFKNSWQEADINPECTA